MINKPTNVSDDFLIELGNTPNSIIELMGFGFTAIDLQMANLHVSGVSYGVIKKLYKSNAIEDYLLSDYAGYFFEQGECIIENVVEFLNEGLTKKQIALALTLTPEQIDKIIDLSEKEN